MKLQFLGATGNVTGSCAMITLPSGKQILIDCGIMQDNSLDFSTIHRFNSKEFDFDINNISHVVLTHAHLDHIGKLPLLKKRGYTGQILATEPTGQLAIINLKDAAYLMEQEIKKRNEKCKNKYKVIYSIKDALESAYSIQCYDYNTKIHLDKHTTAEFLPNGHMIGSAMIKIEYKNGFDNKSILFTGDTSGFAQRHPFIIPASNIGNVDTIVTESTYGDRFHKKVDIKDELKNIIEITCIDNKKTLLMPVFSIQRSTELLQLLYEVYESNSKFKKIPVYLDSPMAIESTKIINNNKNFWSKEWIKKSTNNQTFLEHNFVKYINDAKKSKYLANGEPKIILSSSGMAQGGRILHHLISFLPSKNCCILFTGYCGEGTLAHKIINTNQKSVNILGSQCRIRANIKQIPFSSHADQNELIELINTCNYKRLKNLFIIHGNKKSNIGFKKRLPKRDGLTITIPKYQEIFKI